MSDVSHQHGQVGYVDTLYVFLTYCQLLLVFKKKFQRHILVFFWRFLGNYCRQIAQKYVFL